MNARFHELDGLRAIAALAVVVSHYTGTYNFRYIHDPKAAFDFPQGAFGVQLFFLISGFVILMSAARAQQPSDFVISRVSRLYPAYWLSLVLALVISRLFEIPHTQTSISETLINFTMVQRWFQVPNIVDVYWTLTVEVQFYILMFSLLLLTKCRVTGRVIIIVTIAWLVTALVVAAWAGPFSRGVNPQNVVTPVKVVLNLTLAEYGPLFCCGMLAYISRRDGKPGLLMFIAASVSVAVAAILHSWIDAAIVAGICFSFIYVVLRKRTSWLRLGPLQWFGKISYSMYIVHSLAGYAVIKLTWPYVGRDAAMLVAFLVSSLLAWGLYSLAERNGSSALKRLLVDIRSRVRDRRRRNPARE